MECWIFLFIMLAVTFTVHIPAVFNFFMSATFYMRAAITTQKEHTLHLQCHGFVRGQCPGRRTPRGYKIGKGSEIKQWRDSHRPSHCHKRYRPPPGLQPFHKVGVVLNQTNNAPPLKLGHCTTPIGCKHCPPRTAVTCARTSSLAGENLLESTQRSVARDCACLRVKLYWVYGDVRKEEIVYV